jgi:Ca-activated chloride channel family protein
VSFQAPLFLLALALLPLAAFAYVRGERRRRGVVVAAPLLASVAPRRPRWRRHVPPVFYAVALAALIVAHARPQATIAVPTEQATVVIATDRSGSMLATDVAPSRLVAARRAAETFLEAVPDDLRVGAIAFNHRATVLQSPTREHAAVREALQAVQAAGSTATGDALAAALQLVKSARASAQAKAAPAAIILLSDGKSVRGRDALAVAAEAKAARVPVYTVALGTASGTVKGEPVPPDPATLRSIAETTGGKAFAIEDAGKLAEVYERLGSELATEKRELEVTSAFAGGALLLMAGAAVASLAWFGRLL